MLGGLIERELRGGGLRFALPFAKGGEGGVENLPGERGVGVESCILLLSFRRAVLKSVLSAQVRSDSRSKR